MEHDCLPEPMKICWLLSLRAHYQQCCWGHRGICAKSYAKELKLGSWVGEQASDGFGLSTLITRLIDHVQG